tara:strand:+ start:17894 stop:19573 length:1680 start_codon:yes stop_codon:yes gene_type:complete
MSKRELIILSCLLSFCSISYELLFANALAIMAGNIVWWHSVTIGIYVAGLGFGTFKSTKTLFPVKKLVSIELKLSIIGALSVASIYCFSAVYETLMSIAKVGYITDYAMFVTLKTQVKMLYFIMCQSLVFSVGYFSGFELPLLISLNSSDEQSNFSVNRLIAANYFGTLIGTLTFAYFLIPKLDTLYSSLVVASLNLLICLWISLKSKRLVSSKVFAAITGVALMLSVGFLGAKKFEQTFLRVYYRAGTTFLSEANHDLKSWWNLTMEDGDVTRIKTLYQYIDYFNLSWKGEDEFLLMINTNFQFNSSTERSYHEAFAHIPLLISGSEPQKILVLGAGDGLLLRELKKYPAITDITHVELDEEIVELSKNHPAISELNEGVLSDPTIKRIIGDAFQFLRKTEETFDAIYIDFPYPQDYNVAKLFSVEFYKFVKRTLREDGFAVIDVPLRLKEGKTDEVNRRFVELQSNFSDNDFRRNSVVLSTVEKAGFNTRIPYLVGKETFLFMTNSKSKLNYDLFGKTSPLYPTLDNDSLSLINRQYFPHEISNDFINSIFHPQIVE